MYAPPEGVPSLDEVFPRLSNLCFHSTALPRNLMFFQLTRSCAGAIEVGSEYDCADMLHAPYPFADAEAFLITANHCKGLPIMPYCRHLFPTILSAAGEAKIQKIKSRMLIRAKQTSIHEESVTRLTAQELADARAALRTRGFDFKKAFPKCNMVYKRVPLWISYKGGQGLTGVLTIAKGKSRAENRGVCCPRGGEGVAVEVAKVSHKLTSLQELFCLTESLLRNLTAPQQTQKRRRLL
jgi:hypothetical protein